MLWLKLQFDTTLRSTDTLAFNIFSLFLKKNKKNLTQCCSHKDLHSPELHQFGFGAARSIKTALLEVTKGLCRVELKATSFPSPVSTPHCRLLTSWPCFCFLCLTYLQAFLLMDHHDEHAILLSLNTGSLCQSLHGLIPYEVTFVALFPAISSPSCHPLSCFMLCCCSDHIKHSLASTWSDTKAKV